MRKNRKRKILRAVRESAVVLSIAAFLSSFLPYVMGSSPDPATLAAKNSCERVRAALLQYKVDTGIAPNQTAPGQKVLWLVGPGEVPSNFSAVNTSAATLDAVLAPATDDHLPGYDGPYLMFGGSDSWGRSIVAHVGGFESDETTWILSAGPDGILETQPSDREPRGDDIGVILEKR